MLSHSVINPNLVSKPVSVFIYKQHGFLLLVWFFFNNLIVKFLSPAKLKFQPAALLNKPQKCNTIRTFFPHILASHHAIFVVCSAGERGVREDYLVAGLCYG